MPVVKFDLSLYKKEAIVKAVEAFSNHALFKGRESKKKKEFSLSIKALHRHQEKTVIGEFCNYALGATKQCL